MDWLKVPIIWVQAVEVPRLVTVLVVMVVVEPR
jgi:hypothetical protein